MIPALILPPRPARKARRPATQPASPAVQCPTRGTRPAIAPPPVLDALAQNASHAASCDERSDGAVEHQDADPDAEWADLEPWMHHAIGFDGCPLEQGFGAGESVGGRLLWWSQIAGQA